VAEIVIKKMKDDYPELKKNKELIIEQLVQEEERFKKAIKEGLKAAEKIFATKKPIARRKFVKLMQEEDKTQILHGVFEKKRQKKPYDLKEFGISKKEFDEALLSGQESFYLYQSFGLPIEMILELVREKNLFVPKTDFRNEVKKHQELSRAGAEQKFAGGLADHSEQVTKFHTATHLLLASLRQVLGDHVWQKGSNITEKRLRFDFSHGEKLTDAQKKKVEDLVNAQIKKNIPVEMEETTMAEAKTMGATGVFAHKYGNKVKVYKIGDFSLEICGGPHAKSTGELGHFKIKKEESSSAGVRRIKAILK
jgi:alanyl-tRNA synthetase